MLDLEHPELELPESTYTITFHSPVSGSWHGVGLRFAPGGQRRLALSASTYNQGGACWQFAGAGGQSSLVVPESPSEDAARYGHEINVFHGRSRSMLVALWLPQAGPPAGHRPWRLEQLAVTPFRCSLQGPPDPPRPEVRDPQALLEAMAGWPGTREWLASPSTTAPQQAESQPCDPFEPATFAVHPITRGFADGLVASLPEWLPHDAFRLEVGCRVSPDQFQRLRLHVNAEGRLNGWERCRYRAPHPETAGPDAAGPDAEPEAR